MIKRILFLCSVYKPNVGGVETSIDELSRALAQQRIESRILTKRFPHTLPETEVVGDAKVFRFERPKTDAEYAPVLKRVLALLDGWKPDIIHLIGIRRPMPLFALFLAKFWRVPLLVTFAGGDLPDKADPESLSLWNEGASLVPQAVRQADSWSAFSEYTAKQARDAVGNLGHTYVVFGGVNTQAIASAKPAARNRPYFLVARRLERVKGIDILLDAFASVADMLPSYELVIAGDGSARAALKEQAKRLGIGDKVVFLGAVSQTEVFSFMKGAAAHICPSRAESGGLVNWEAQAAGCVSIGSDAGGIPEYIVDGKTGLVFQNGDARELARKLISCIKEPDVMKRMRDVASELSIKRGWDEFCRTYQKLYYHITAGYSYKPLVAWSPLSEELVAIAD